jgi:hypothetical protein
MLMRAPLGAKIGVAAKFGYKKPVWLQEKLLD